MLGTAHGLAGRRRRRWRNWRTVSRVTKVAGIEARGFLLAAPVAVAAGVGRGADPQGGQVARRDAPRGLRPRVRHGDPGDPAGRHRKRRPRADRSTTFWRPEVPLALPAICSTGAGACDQWAGGAAGAGGARGSRASVAPLPVWPVAHGVRSRRQVTVCTELSAGVTRATKGTSAWPAGVNVDTAQSSA